MNLADSFTTQKRLQLSEVQLSPSEGPHNHPHFPGPDDLQMQNTFQNALNKKETLLTASTTIEKPDCNEEKCETHLFNRLDEGSLWKTTLGRDESCEHSFYLKDFNLTNYFPD